MSETQTVAIDTARLTTIYKNLRTAKDIALLDLPPMRWIVPNLIAENSVTILAGKPKVGKSWLTLQLASAISAGVSFFGQDTPRGNVLYMALEDGVRRIKDRTDKLGSFMVDNLSFIFEWSRGQKAIEDLDMYLGNAVGTRIVIIDTLGRVLPSGSDSNDYSSMGDFIAEIQRLAIKYEVAFLLIHHANKLASEDFVSSVLGSTAIAGSADAILALRRTRGQTGAVLGITGRDVEEKELALSFALPGGWKLEGDAHEVRMSEERRAILGALADGPLTPREVADRLGKNYSTIKNTLWNMSKAGEVAVEKGKYSQIDRRPDRPVDPGEDSPVYESTQSMVFSGLEGVTP